MGKESVNLEGKMRKFISIVFLIKIFISRDYYVVSMNVKISNILKMRPKTRTIVLQEGSNSGNHSPHSPPSRPLPAKTDLK